MTTRPVRSAAATLETSRFTRARFMRRPPPSRRRVHAEDLHVVRALEAAGANNARAHAALHLRDPFPRVRLHLRLQVRRRPGAAKARDPAQARPMSLIRPLSSTGS